MAYGSALDVRSCAKKEGSWTFDRVSVRTYACVCGLGWGTRHGVWVGTGRVSWTDKDVGFFEGGVNVTPGPIWMAHQHRCACLVPHC
jgi:hypothetical protein